MKSSILRLSFVAFILSTSVVSFGKILDSHFVNSELIEIKDFSSPSKKVGANASKADDPTFTVTVQNDALDEGDVQTITVTLDSASDNVSKFKIKNNSSSVTSDDYQLSLGGEVTFSKKWSDDPENELYQDRINKYAWLTRETQGAPLNKSTEYYQGAYSSDGPTNIRFALGSYANIDNLTFRNWRDMRNQGHHPKENTNKNYVMRVVGDVDAEGTLSYDYYNIVFTYWDENGRRDDYSPNNPRPGTSYIYTRSKFPINEDAEGYSSFEIAAGETEFTMTVATTADNDIEGVDNYSFSIVGDANVALVEKTADFTVNDQTEITFTVSSTEVSEGDSIDLTASIAEAKPYDTEVFVNLTGEGITAADYSLTLATNANFDYIVGGPDDTNAIKFESSALDYAQDSNHNIYVLDQDQKIFKVTPEGVRTELSTNASNLKNILIKNDYLYLLYRGKVSRQYVGEDASISPDVEDIILNGQGQLLNQFNNDWESQFHVDDNLNIYVSDVNNHRVVKYAYDAYDQDPVLIAGDENGSSGNALNLLYYPRAMVVASDGTVYVADWDNNRVIKFTEGTAEGEVILNKRVRGALYLDENDALYMAIWDGSSVYKKEPGKAIEQLTTEYISSSTAMLVDNTGGIYLYNNDNNRIIYYAKGQTSSPKVISEGFNLGQDSYYGGAQLQFDQNNNLLFYNRGNGIQNSILRFNTNTPKIVIDAGDTSSSMSLLINNDNSYENVETLTLSPSSIRDNEITSASVTVNSTDNLPVVSMALSAASIEENQTEAVTLIFTMDVSSVLDVSFDLALSGTATVETEYALSATTVSIPAGQTTASVTISTADLNDTAIEVLETILVTPTGVTNATLASENISLSLLSDDYPSFAVAVEKDAIDEGGTNEIILSLEAPQSKVSKFKIKNNSSSVTSDEYQLSLGGEVTFSKKWSDDPENELYQDRINKYAWLTRGTQGAPVNKSTEYYQSNYSGDGPTNIRFALGSYANIDNLTFRNWRDMRNQGQHPKENTNKNYVMRVVGGVDAEGTLSYDYYNIVFTYWDQRGRQDDYSPENPRPGTSYIYTRSKFPINEDAEGYSSFEIAAGETEFTMTVATTADNDIEGVDNYSFSIVGDANVALVEKTADFTVNDQTEITFTVSSTEVSEGDSIDLTASIAEAKPYDTEVFVNLTGEGITAADYSLTLATNANFDYIVGGPDDTNAIKFESSALDYAQDSNHNIYVLDQDQKIFKITPEGVRTELSTNASNLKNILIKNDYLYLLYRGKVSRQYVGEDASISPDVEDIILNGQGQLLNQFNNDWESQFHVDDNLNIYVSDVNNHRVVKYAYDAYDQDPVLIAGDENGNNGNSLNLLSEPRGMVVASDGTVYVADWNNQRVIKFTEGTAEGEVILNKRVRGALYLDDNDILYMVTWEEGYVYKKEPGKTIEQLTTEYIRSSTGLLVDSSEGIYVYNRDNSRIVYYAKGQTSSPKVISEGFNLGQDSYYGGAQLQFDQNNNLLFYNRGNGIQNSILRFNTNTPKIVIDAGDTSSSMSLLINNDSLYENDEILSISATSIRDNEIASASVTVNSTDNLPVVSMALSATSIEENQTEAVTLIFTMDVVSVLDVSFDLALSGTATAETEYALSATTVSIPAGQTTASVTISTAGKFDDEIEALETIVLSPTGITNATLASENISLGLLSDDYPSFTVSPDTNSFREGDTQEFTIELSDIHSKETTANLSLSGTMDSNDYNIVFDDSYSKVAFSKKWSDDPNSSAFQDRINDNVWLTRDSNGGFLQNKSPSQYENDHQRDISPKGVQIAFGSYDNIENLTFHEGIQGLNNSGYHVRNNLGANYILRVASESSSSNTSSSSWLVNNQSGEVPISTDETGNSYYSVNVANAGNAWDVNLVQKLAITEGTTYTLTFDAWSDVDRTIIAGIGLSEEPWTTSTKTQEPISITPTKTTYTFTHVANFGAPVARLLFDLGAEAGMVNIDNVSLTSGSENLITNGDFENQIEDPYNYYNIVFTAWADNGRQDPNPEEVAVTYTRDRYPISAGSQLLVIPAGQKEMKYTIEFTDDLSFEGVETLVNSFELTNSSTSDFSRTFEVNDEINISTSISNTELTEGETTTITAVIDEVRSVNTTVNFNISGTADGSDIASSLELPNNGISTLFGVTGFNENEITEMILHNNTVYFSVRRSGVFKINEDKTYTSLIDYKNGNNPSVRSFTFDAEDNLYVIEEHTVYKYSVSSNYKNKLAVTIENNYGSELNQLRDPSSIILDANGNLIIADTGNHRLVKWEQGGTEGTLLFGDPNGGYASGSAGLNSPEDIVFDGTYYYVLDNNNRRRIVVLDSEFNYVSSTINFNGSTAPEQYFIRSMFIKNNKMYVPLGMKDWNTSFGEKQGEIAVFNTYSDNTPMVLEDLMDFKYLSETNEQIIPANQRGYFIIDNNGNFFLQGDGNKIYFKQNAPQIIIPAGSLSSTVEVQILDDLSFEGPEQLILDPNSPNSAIEGNLTIDITDNDTAPKMNISFSAPFIDENQEEAVNVNFTPEVVSGLEISFDISLSGTATIETEYSISNQSVTIPANSSGTVQISTAGLDDSEIEIAETIIFKLTNLTNATFDTLNIATLELHSDDYPEASLAIDDTEFAEHEVLELKATLSAPHSKETVISYDVVENGAIAEQYIDYFFASEAGNVTFVKPGWASDTDPEYQDRISETVWLTRGKQHGVYNAKNQVSQQRQQTSGIMLALGSIENLSELTFESISRWGRKFREDRDGSWLNRECVLYLTETKEYYTFIMTSWDRGRQGGFSYTRSKGSVKNSLEFVIPAGSSQGSASITGVEDELMTEGTEEFSLTYNSITNGTIAQTDNITLTILDNITSMTLREDVFTGVQNGDFSWGDFDSDGDKDLALIGDAGSTLISKVYENTKDESGKVVFKEIDVQFTGVGFGAVEWVDLNQDGKVDLFISGVDENVAVRSLVYINKSTQGTPSFELVDTYNFPELVETSLDFGDLDNDGDVDYAITGYDSQQNLKAYYGYQNLETKNFEIQEANFEAFVNGELRIVDIDADGDNDVIYTGGNETTGNRGGVIYNTYVPNDNSGNYWDSWWQNDQLRSKYSTLEIFKPQDSKAIGYMVMGEEKGYAVNSPLAVPQLKNGDIAAGDFNNNGIDDFLFTGETAGGEGYTKLFEGKSKPVLNAETNAYDLYVESVFKFDPLINSSVEWVDFDNDGDLDLFMTGLKIGEGEKTYLYETEVNNKKNAKPALIDGLDANLVGNGVVELSWSKPVDDFTSSLGYNVRLGTSEGGSELSYTISNIETGDLLISRSPNNYNLFYQTKLEPGTYYWSVQAVDQGLKAGPYSEENSFTITYDWKILNQGGLFDKSISAGQDPMLKVVDIDNDEDLDVILSVDNQIKFYSYDQGILESTTINGFNEYQNNVKEIQFADFMNLGKNSLFISADNQMRAYGFNDEFNQGFEKVISDLNLFDEKYGIADFNNDGVNEIFVIGVDSDIDVFMKVKFYMYFYDNSTGSFSQTDLTDQISDIGRIKGPSFDFGDYDNDQDLDIIVSGDKIVGTSITKIFKNITLPGETDISLEVSDENITGVSNGSTNFIDFDSDGDLDIMLSGTDDTGVDVFEILQNDQTGTWPSVETNLLPMKNTNVDLGDFNGDGYIDMLFSGETAAGKVTKLMEYTPAAGFIESNFDLSDIVDARVEFGDLDGDEDLDFVIAGKNKDDESKSIFRTYLNYRNESYLITNPPTFQDIDFMVTHEGNNTQVIMRENVSVASVLLEYEKEVSLDFAATITGLLELSSNGNPLTVVTNKNNVILYGDVTKAFSRQDFSTILVHNSENLKGEVGNSLQRILSVAALKDGKLKSITADSKIYDPLTDDLASFTTKTSGKASKKTKTKILRSSLFSKNSSSSTNADDIVADGQNTNVKPDMPFLLNSTVLDGELDKSLGKLFVELTWNSAVDDNTDLEGLSYAIKMGTSPGAEDVVSSNSSVNGVRKAAGKGNAEHNTKWKIALKPGTYYWSVQSIDNGQTGSEFSFEDVFTVSEDNLLYDLGDSNGDDNVNIADIINTVDHMLGIQLARFIEYATDVNDDNMVNVLDLMGIVDIILNPTITTTNSENKYASRKKSVDQIDYRSSNPVGDAYFYWVNESLYMESDHKVGGLQFSINNDAEVTFSEDLSVLNKTKIQKEGVYEMLMYSVDATPLDSTSEILRYYGNQDDFDLNSLIVSTTDGGKLNVVIRTLSNDDIIDLDSFTILGVYPNPATENILNIEFFAPSPLINQSISIIDLLGREIYTDSNINTSSGKQRIAIDLKNIPSGVFFLEFSVDLIDKKGIKHISKFIKQ